MTLQTITVGNTSIIIGADGGFTVMPGGERIDIDLGGSEAPVAAAQARPRFEKVPEKFKPGHAAVIDSQTGLMWSVESLGDPDDADNGITQEHCMERCRELRLLGHDDWRLPTRNELVTLIDDTRRDPAIDPDMFPGVKPRWHWTSTPAAWSSASAWYVHFSYGLVYYYRRGYGGFALAVRRAGQ